MFGFRISIVKKKDVQDVEMFKNVVFSINDVCEHLGNLLANNFELTEYTSHLIREDIVKLRSLFEMYLDNTYSLPSASMYIGKELEILSKNVFHIDTIRHNANTIGLIRGQYKNNIEKYGLDESEEFEDQYNKSLNASAGQLQTTLNAAMNALYLLQSTISHDVIRLIMGVDIYEEHKRRLKRNNSPTGMTIKYSLIPEGDRLFSEKEKMKK